MDEQELEQQKQAEADAKAAEEAARKAQEEANAAKKTGDSEELERTRAALAKANDEAKKYRLKAKAFEGIDLDPEQVKQIIEKHKESEKQRQEREIERKKQEGKFEELIEKSRKEAEEAIKAKDSVIDSYKQKLESYLVEGTLNEIYAKEKLSPKLANPLIKPYVKAVSNEDGEYEVVVLDNDGTPKLNNEGKRMSVSEFVESLKSDDDYAVLFPAPSNGGAGGKQSDRQPGGQKPSANSKRSSMTLEQKLEFQKQYGMEAYQKLPF